MLLRLLTSLKVKTSWAVALAMACVTERKTIFIDGPVSDLANIARNTVNRRLK